MEVQVVHLPEINNSTIILSKILLFNPEITLLILMQWHIVIFIHHFFRSHKYRNRLSY